MNTRMLDTRPPASVAGRVAALLLLVVVAFQAAVAAGAPFGEATYGGATAGVLPDSLRIASGVSAIVYLVLATVAGTAWVSRPVRRGVLLGGAALMLLGALVNLASPSFVERMIWTPVTVTLVITLWLSAQHVTLARTAGPGRGVNRS